MKTIRNTRKPRNPATVGARHASPLHHAHIPMKTYPQTKTLGLDWLPEIPAHWEVKKLKNILVNSVINGLLKKKEEFGDGTLFVNVTDLYMIGNTVDVSKLDRVRTTATEINTFGLRPNDIFFVRSSLKLEGIG